MTGEGDNKSKKGLAGLLGKASKVKGGAGNKTGKKPQDETGPDGAGSGQASKDNSVKKDRIKVRIGPQSAVAASRKRWMIVAGGVVLVIVLISALMSNHKQPVAQNNTRQDGVDLTPKGTLRQDFEASTQATLLQLKNQSHALGKRADQTDQALENLSRGQNDLKRSIKQLEGKIGQQGRVGSGQGNTTPPPAPPGVPSPPPTHADSGPKIPSTPPPPPTFGEQGSSTAVLPIAPSVPTAPGPMVLVPESGNGGQAAQGKDKAVGSHQSYKKNPKAGYLPSGSFAPVALLTGVEAGTAQSSQSDPQPVLMRIEQPAILPGAARYSIASCFVLGSAYGSMSTERAYIRLATLSCIDSNHHLVLDTPLKGYLVDSDGMFGLRGQLVQRQGALLAKSLLAGFASGLSDALGNAQGTSFTGSFGSGTTISGSSAMRQAGLGGASKAANRLADFYLKEAESIFPVIEIKPRRKATLVLTSGVSLKWDDYGSLYVKQVTPEK